MTTITSPYGTVRQWQRYPTYKSSGVTWCSEIPHHWTVTALKRLARFQSGDNITSLQIDSDGLFPVYGGNGLRGYGPQFTHDGDYVLLGRQGALCGNVNYASGKFWASEHAVVVAPNSRVDLHWLGELLRAMNLGQYSQSAAQPGLSVQFVVNLGAPIPPLDEQRCITAFLDRETANIDGLIVKNERLIELLQEKRTALISHAVTKGLDPTVAMKDSGIEWLGKIPGHWQTRRIGRFSRVGNGSTPLRENKGYWEDGVFPWLNSSVVNDAVVGEPSRFVSKLALLECHLPVVTPGSILVAITGEGKTRGKASLLNYEATINQHLAYIQLSAGVADVEYVRFYIESVYEMLRFLSDGAGSTKGAITCEQLRHFRVPLPPIQEQGAISRWLKSQTNQVDALIAKVRDAIDKLREYRTALISAAVTGKIDVREEAAA